MHLIFPVMQYMYATILPDASHLHHRRPPTPPPLPQDFLLLLLAVVVGADTAFAAPTRCNYVPNMTVNCPMSSTTTPMYSKAGFHIPILRACGEWPVYSYECDTEGTYNMSKTNVANMCYSIFTYNANYGTSNEPMGCGRCDPTDPTVNCAALDATPRMLEVSYPSYRAATSVSPALTQASVTFGCTTDNCNPTDPRWIPSMDKMNGDMQAAIVMNGSMAVVVSGGMMVVAGLLMMLV